MVSAMAGARVDGCCVVRVIVRIWRQRRKWIMDTFGMVTNGDKDSTF